MNPTSSDKSCRTSHEYIYFRNQYYVTLATTWTHVSGSWSYNLLARNFSCPLSIATAHLGEMQIRGAADDTAWRPSWKARVRDPDEMESYRQATVDGAFDLLLSEVWWRDHSTFLESRGYRLRPRFRPGWSPSWMASNFNPLLCEDGQNLDVFPFPICSQTFNLSHRVGYQRYRRFADERRIYSIYQTNSNK